VFLFGSRSPYSTHPARQDSDIDVFVESEDELSQIPAELLIDNGGPIDAFWFSLDTITFSVGGVRVLEPIDTKVYPVSVSWVIKKAWELMESPRE